jgi:hypothetical protein
MMDEFEVFDTQQGAAHRGLLTIWTIYDKPKDHPDGFIARRFEVGADGPVPTGDIMTGDLEDMRETLWKAGLLKLTRDPLDEPQIVESWV